MAQLQRIQNDYFGTTLYILTRTGREYACRAETWTRGTGGSLDVRVSAWPGYGNYRGMCHLSRTQAALFLQALEQGRS